MPLFFGGGRRGLMDLPIFLQIAYSELGKFFATVVLK
jgi:hypothetical protein